MRDFLIHKNVHVYPWLRKKIGRQRVLRVTNTVEKIIFDIEIFLMISFLTIGGLFLFWIFLVFLNVTSF